MTVSEDSMPATSSAKGKLRNNMDSFWNHLRWRGEIV